MRWQCQPSETGEQFHVEAHVDVCADHTLHIQIGNLCLHVCQRDFLQIAKAVNAAVARLPNESIGLTQSKAPTEPQH